MKNFARRRGLCSYLVNNNSSRFMMGNSTTMPINTWCWGKGKSHQRCPTLTTLIIFLTKLALFNPLIAVANSNSNSERWMRAGRCQSFAFTHGCFSSTCRGRLPSSWSRRNTSMSMKTKISIPICSNWLPLSCNAYESAFFFLTYWCLCFTS